MMGILLRVLILTLQLFPHVVKSKMSWTYKTICCEYRGNSIKHKFSTKLTLLTYKYSNSNKKVFIVTYYLAGIFFQ